MRLNGTLFPEDASEEFGKAVGLSFMSGDSGQVHWVGGITVADAIRQAELNKAVDHAAFAKGYLSTMIDSYLEATI